jgi:hypothetical protein
VETRSDGERDMPERLPKKELHQVRAVVKVSDILIFIE